MNSDIFSRKLIIFADEVASASVFTPSFTTSTVPAEANCYCELYSCLVPASVLASKELKGIILSGGPASVYEEGAPHVSPEVWTLIAERRLPVLGLCYGAQEIAQTFGGTVERAGKREFGPATLSVPSAVGLFAGVSPSSQVSAAFAACFTF